MSINCLGQTVAVAYHDSLERTISILEDTQDSATFDLLMSCMFAQRSFKSFEKTDRRVRVLDQLCPDLVLVNANAHSDLLDALMEYCKATTTGLYFRTLFNLNLR
jgi:hypothetical protein